MHVVGDTIPGIGQVYWPAVSQQARQKFLVAAVARPRSSGQLLVPLEPEAVSFHCRSIPCNQMRRVKDQLLTRKAFFRVFCEESGV